MSWVFAFLVLAKSAAAFKEMSIAWRFGVGEVADAYVFSMAIILWFPALLQSLLTSVAVPVLLKVDSEAIDGRSDFFGEFSGLVICSGLLWTLVVALVALLDFVPGTLGSVAAQMLLHMALIGTIASITAGLAVRLLARERYGMNLIEGIPALVLIPIIALAATPSADLLSFGTIAGYLLSLVVALFYAASRGVLARPRIGLASKYWRAVFGGLGVMLVSQIVMSLTNIVDPWMAAGLEKGEVAALGYANRLIGLLLTLGGTLVASSIFPVLSAIAVREGHCKVFEHTKRWLFTAFLVGVVTLLIGWTSAPYLIAMLFERGEFSVVETVRVTEIFRAAILQLPFYMSGIILVQALAATGNYRWIAAGAIGIFIVKLAANIVLAPALGAAGIAFGTAIMYASSFLFLLFAMRRSARECIS